MLPYLLSRRQVFRLTFGSALGLGLGTQRIWAAAAEAVAGWPDGQPVKVIVPGAPGNLAYNMMRFFLAERLGAAFGVVVDVVDRANRNYAAGAEPGVAVDAPDQLRDPEGVADLLKAAPDGHTLAFADISQLVRASYLGKTAYDLTRDFAPVASLFAAPVLLLATSALPAQDAPDFKAWLARAKQKPGAIRWAARGSASLGHLILEQVKIAAGVNIAHVPYPDGGGAIIADALAGKFDLLAVPAGPALIRPIKDGRLRPLAVSAPARLDKQLPNVPTLAELGLASANLSSIYGFFAPAATPQPILQRLTQVVNAQSRDAEVRHHIDAQGLVAVSGSAADFLRVITEMAGNIHAALQNAGIKTAA